MITSLAPIDPEVDIPILKAFRSIKMSQEWSTGSSFVIAPTAAVGSFYNRQTQTMCHTRWNKSSEMAGPSFQILSNWLPKDCLSWRQACQHLGRSRFLFYARPKPFVTARHPQSPEQKQQKADRGLRMTLSTDICKRCKGLLDFGLLPKN